MLLNCGVGEDSWESWDLRPLDYKEIQPVHPKGDQSWIFTGRTDAEAEPPILWPPDAKTWLIGKDPDSGKDQRQEEDRGWDGWMTPLTEWTWVWVNSRSWWRTGRPGVLQSMGSQSQTWLNDWTETLITSSCHFFSNEKGFTLLSTQMLPMHHVLWFSNCSFTVWKCTLICTPNSFLS